MSARRLTYGGLFLILPLALSTSAFSSVDGEEAEQIEDDLEQFEAHLDEGETVQEAHGKALHGGHHVPHFSDINWAYGFLGEKEGVEPGLLWRAPGTPVPFGALLLNTAILFFLIGRFGGPGIKKGLVGRKEKIAGDIERASKMRAEAEEQLSHYEEKLEQMGAEMRRIRATMNERAEDDRRRILEEAKERRVIIEAESRAMIAQELTQARHDATVKVVSGAIEAARQEIVKGLNPADHDRLATEFLSNLSTKLQSKGISS